MRTQSLLCIQIIAGGDIRVSCVGCVRGVGIGIEEGCIYTTATVTVAATTVTDGY